MFVYGAPPWLGLGWRTARITVQLPTRLLRPTAAQQTAECRCHFWFLFRSAVLRRKAPDALASIFVLHLTDGHFAVALCFLRAGLLAMLVAPSPFPRLEAGRLPGVVKLIWQAFLTHDQRTC